MKLNAEDKIIKAKITLGIENPFFASIAVYLNPNETDEIPTIGVDKNGNLPYNKKWVESLPDNVLKNVLCHEIMHIALEHLYRSEGCDMRKFNLAADIVINHMLEQDEMGDLPKEGILPKNGRIVIEELGINISGIHEKSTEQIYSELPEVSDDKKEPCNGFDTHIDSSNSDNGDSKDSNGESDSMTPVKSDELVKEVWKQRIIAASVEARSKGKLSSSMGRMVDILVETIIPWQILLNRFLQKNIVIDYTWSRPSKKSLACGIYLPSPVKENLDVAVHIDTSGSVFDKMLSLYVSEINSMFSMYENINIDIISGDSKLRSYTKISNNRRLSVRDIDLSGGGGTSHEFVLDWITTNKPNTQVLISFTDGCSDINYVWEKYNPSFKTIFIGIKNCGNNDKVMRKYGEYVESVL